MPLLVNTFADFLADFPYDAGWLSGSTEDIPGKEVSEVLVSGLRKQGIEIERLDADVTGRSLFCLCEDRSFTIMVFVDDLFEMKRWNVQCSPSESLLTRLIHGRADSEFQQVLAAVDQALKESDRVRDIRWFPCFDPHDALDLRQAAPTPFPGDAALRRMRYYSCFDRACTLLGLCLGGYSGLRQYQAALDKGLRVGNPGAHLAVDISCGAFSAPWPAPSPGDWLSVSGEVYVESVPAKVISTGAFVWARCHWLVDRGDLGDEFRVEEVLRVVLGVKRDLAAAAVPRDEVRVIDEEFAAVGEDQAKRLKGLAANRLRQLVQGHLLSFFLSFASSRDKEGQRPGPVRPAEAADELMVGLGEPGQAVFSLQ